MPPTSDPDILDYLRFASRTIQGRDLDPAEQEHLAARLAARETTPGAYLRELVATNESVLRGEGRTYSWTDDEHLLPFRTPEILAFSQRLQEERPLPRDTVEAAYRERFEVELRGQEDEEQHLKYGREHARRFLEMVNAMTILLEGRSEARILDFGLSVFTALYHRLFPHHELVTSERPVPPDLAEFFARQNAAAGAAALFHNDLNDPHFLPPAREAEMGKFDLILFTEVLEHLTVHPGDVLSAVARLLRPGGHLYLTTPNFFSRHRLNEIARRLNPQPIFPRDGNADVHHHYREYGMSELLGFVTEAGLEVTGFTFSDCWEEPALAAELEGTPDQRSNLVVTARRPG